MIDKEIFISSVDWKSFDITKKIAPRSNKDEANEVRKKSPQKSMKKQYWRKQEIKGSLLCISYGNLKKVNIE